MFSWNTDSSKLNSTYLRIARQAGIASNPPHSCPIRTESKGKSAPKVSTATDELQYLMDFNSSICQTMAMKHLMDFVFGNMANVTLIRRDTYLSYLKAGIKPDTLAALRTAPLFPVSLSKLRRILPTTTRVVLAPCIRRIGTTPMKGRKRSRITGSRTDRHGRTFLHMVRAEGIKGNTSTHPDQPRASSPINDNYCVKGL